MVDEVNTATLQFMFETERKMVFRLDFSRAIVDRVPDLWHIFTQTTWFPHRRS